MTDNDDNMNLEEEHAIDSAVEHEETFAEDEEDDGSAQYRSDEGGSAEDELTPNDIFGLDPLDVLTLEELAEYLKVSPAAARRVMKEQNLPGRNIGGEWRFLRDAVANWLRGQETAAVQQQKARDDYSKSKPATTPQAEEGRYSRPPQTSYQAEQSGGGEYRPRQRYGEGEQRYGNQGGGQYGNRGGNYGGGGNQYSGGQNSGSQYGGGGYGGGEQGGGYARPPRRPFRSTEGGQYGGGADAGGSTGYGGGSQFGGGYGQGQQRFGGGPKRKNKRQVFESERGKRLDRRKQDDAPDGQE